MTSHLLKSLAEVLVNFEIVYLAPLLGRQMPPSLIPVFQSSVKLAPQSNSSFDIREIFDGFMWGVPTGRRSVEKRMMRKYGAPNWHNKLILPKTNIKVCLSCGDYHEEKRLCPKCYARIKEETTLLQEKMVQELGLNPIEKEVAIVYQGEKQQFDDDFFQNKKVVEMEKPRPKWFSRNLLQKTGPATELGNETTAIKPHDLG